MLRLAFKYCPNQNEVFNVPENYQAKCTEIYNLIWDIIGLGDKFLLLKEPNHLTKFFRRMANQQFWLQEGMEGSYTHLGRQHYLFEELNDMYVQVSGISVRDYIQLEFILSSVLASDENPYRFSKDLWGEIASSFPDGQIDKFLATISKTPQEAQDFILQLPARPLEQERYEKFPLKAYPLMRLGDWYYCYSNRIYFYFLANHLYDLLKEKFSRDFAGRFGGVFERYLALSLNEHRYSYLSEASFKQLYQERVGTETKAVDYILACPSATILVEAKGVELSNWAQAEPTNAVLGTALQDTVVKAIKQGFEVAHNLKLHKQSFPEILEPERFILLVVTYKELYLGLGHNVWEEFLRNEVASSLAAQGIPLDTISPFEIFFLDVDDYDKIIYLSNGDLEKLVEILTRFAEQDEANPYEVMTTSQRVMKLMADGGNQVKITHLERLCDDITSEAINRFIQAKQLASSQAPIL
jgi:hypothetical protein